ncbi:MAG: citrate lyase holo-[acyl-carrier protein] synthase [Synergistes sp.]|nr:citrate lyase holo-[acyl-carrier protein] synthase [Synergistes sp.]
MTPLEEVLSGREERAKRQHEALFSAAGNNFVCQISLNIPGYPKHITGDKTFLERAWSLFLARTNAVPKEEKILDNGAGISLLARFDAEIYDAASFKMIAAAIEEESPAGRLLDIDIITREGTLSRSGLGMPERRCLLCGEPAKDCARLHRHSADRLRKRISELLDLHSFC